MGENRTKWSAVAHTTLVSERLGLHALVLEYRGFADSEGTPTEEGVYADARAATRWLRDRGVTPCKLLIWGHSLGTGVACNLAHELCALLLHVAMQNLSTRGHA